MITDTVYENLITQLMKLFNHNRQGAIKTKERYLEAMKRFCRFLADIYRLEKLANIGPKHVRAYVDYMTSRSIKVKRSRRSCAQFDSGMTKCQTQSTEYRQTKI